MLDFAVFGLPRSGTAWIANWLTTDSTLCRHDPFADGLPETWAFDHRKRGVACTGGYLFPQWVDSLQCPIAVIERDVNDCEASSNEIGFHGVEPLARWLAQVKARRWRFEDLWREESACELQAFLLPDLPFDVVRYRQLKQMNVQRDMRHWKPKVGVMEEMQRRTREGAKQCLGV